jgi:GNAT superfamily N-acetyltransferase
MNFMTPCIRTLTAAELPAYEAHLLRLDADARRLRFGYPIGDAAIRAHVACLEPDRDRILARVENGRVVAAAHIARASRATGDITSVEFAFSVDAERRGQRLGRLLLDQALAWARNRGLRRASLYFLADNRAMRTLARRAGMAIRNDSGDCEAALALPPPTPFSLARELAAEHWALWEEQGQRRAPLPLAMQPSY